MKTNNFQSYSLWIGILGWTLSAQIASASPAQGLLIYADTSHYPQVCEYSSLVVGPVYASVRRADGGSFQIITTGTITPVEYPSADLRRVTEEDADENLATIRELRESYPHLEARLAKIEAKWKNALAVARQLAEQPQAPDLATSEPADGVSDRYPDMPRNALAALTAPEPVAESTTTESAAKTDRFAHFGGTALDRRTGFIGDYGRTNQAATREPTDAAAAPSEEDPQTTATGLSGSETTSPDLSSVLQKLADSDNGALPLQDIAKLQAYIQKLLDE